MYPEFCLEVMMQGVENGAGSVRGPWVGRLNDNGDADLLLRGASAVDVHINRCRNQVFRYSQTFHI